ncbi:MAG: hypothetical protein QOH57_3386 [Mycobacterium sp.]|nr:hypothetical protein [Mycobacterium sp.]
MNNTDHVPLVDTTRDELRGRIAEAAARFAQLFRTADPSARPPGHDWTVQQIAAHVVAITHRYLAGAQGREYTRVATPREIHQLNQTELEALLAPLPALADDIQAGATELAHEFDTFTDATRIPFQQFAVASGIAWQTYWLGELLLHGEDVARAIDAPWDIHERDMLLLARGLMEVGHAYLRDSVSRDKRICVAFKLPESRPYVITIHDGIAEFRDRRRDDRPDAVLRGPASALIQMLYGRIGPIAAMRRGLFVVGGRRPWVALKLMSYFEGT